MENLKTILFVMPRLPFPASSGRKTSLYHYCRILSKELGYKLIVAAFLESGDDPNNKPEFIDELIILPKASTIAKIAKIVIDSIMLHKKPMQVSLYWNPEAKKIVNELCKKYKPDYVIGDMVRTTEYIRDIDSMRIADLDDRISLRYKRQLEIGIESINPYGAFLNTCPVWLQRIMLFKPLKLQVLKNEILLLTRYEIEIGKCCDKAIFVAKKEADDFNRELREKKAFAIPNGVDTNYFSYRETGNFGNIIGFLGAMNVAHNEDAVRNFIGNILPSIVDKVPDSLFLVIGGGASKDLIKLESKHVHFTGRVEDVRTYLEQCKVFVCPMTFGSGIKTKNLEAMSMGLPVVTTTVGAENIDAIDGKDWLVVDKNDCFADTVVKLLCEKDYRLRIGKNGSNYIRNNFTWMVAQNGFQKLLG